ncbi:JAB domain-containing protein [Elizabethkingia anophelis]|uniref:RadC domain-containing protein n=1 Tax=Elizabethkingia anophelis TaxID=1117645 RepID=A0A455ZEY8_9FLAO|nr:JAB domain-containing protein [Elizabethkingia anophelis]AQW94905.1 DNA repair protein [Elizabethkingia anophelis]MCL1689655.1 JAB domain-containing protein [Elizabethkingia anophelis]MCT3719501.1 JAB domain-containing protein [Elizabethkingia anophelis]MCT3723011.1 JAB domain-containing protein [Elizabethkingia anophelis]MCT3734171.1 JAB domain-containing protein [Elizabethkingia anophelis]
MEPKIENQELYNISEVQLIYRNIVKASLRPSISCSKDAYEIIIKNWDHDSIEFVEQFKIVLMNNANKVLGIYLVSTGGVNATFVDPKLIYSAALKANASAIILCHNHPSGNLKPSTQDIQLTEKIKNGGKLLEIQVLDHLIVTSEGYLSFQDEGLL